MVWKKITLTYEYQGKKNTLTGNTPLVNEHLSLQTQENSLILSNKVPIRLLSLEVIIPWNYTKKDRIFVHGFQSWSDSREFTQQEKIPGLPPHLRFAYAQYHLEFYGDYHFYDYTRKKGQFHSHGWTLSGQGENWHLVGSLDENSAYTIFEHHPEKRVLRIIRDVEGWEMNAGSITNLLSLFFTSGNLSYAQKRYFEMYGLSPSQLPKISGWTSWYNYYTNISEEIILSNLKSFKEKKLPINIFQIDDGYQTAVGDWLSLKPSFPHGMKYIADAIHEAGFRAGLWLAPFICESKSIIYQKHPEWILRYDDGSPVIAGYSENWNGDFYALDLDHPEVKNYLREVFHTVLHEWGFDMVKLDFLYAASIKPSYGKTRASQMAQALSWIRELCKDKTILGCGVPITSALGKVDYCRIGCDVGLDWEDIRPARIHFRERISTIKAITTTLGRFPLNRIGFINDPDVFILRETNNRLSHEQKYTLYMVNQLFGGLLFTSDNVGEYSSQTENLYRLQFPLAEPPVESLTQHHEIYNFRPRSSSLQAVGPVKIYASYYTGWVKLPFCSAFLIINTGNKTLSQKLPEGIFFDPLQENYHQKTYTVPPYATRILLHILPSERWQYGGSTEHLFPGHGFLSLACTNTHLSYELHSHAFSGGKLFLVSLQDSPLEYQGKPLSIHKHPYGFFYTSIEL
ncbi:glycoside hydrolase family 36 protein [Thermospira aquatica]|uniref:Alpha-galactosidase n=1 Tax=Thermospira aquatica TaxID=2828656 RepID=A0AAX3BBU7_9SPIR|nr:glycoside hydrolase family 36 protein [Thermospira aquatica]URA09664.1 alpha-galactosidase [Thermospira aquatica]